MEDQPNYEFSPQENAAITGLVAQMSLFSWALLVGGPMVSGLGFFADSLLRLVLQRSTTQLTPAFLMVFLSGLVVTVLGLWLRKALQEFKSIVTTEGSDLTHLMTALGQLRLFFRYGAVLAWTLVFILFLILGWYAAYSPPSVEMGIEI